MLIVESRIGMLNASPIVGINNIFGIGKKLFWKMTSYIYIVWLELRTDIIFVAFQPACYHYGDMLSSDVVHCFSVAASRIEIIKTGCCLSIYVGMIAVSCNVVY